MANDVTDALWKLSRACEYNIDDIGVSPHLQSITVVCKITYIRYLHLQVSYIGFTKYMSMLLDELMYWYTALWKLFLWVYR